MFFNVCFACCLHFRRKETWPPSLGNRAHVPCRDQARHLDPGLFQTPIPPWQSSLRPAHTRHTQGLRIHTHTMQKKPFIAKLILKIPEAQSVSRSLDVFACHCHTRPTGISCWRTSSSSRFQITPPCSSLAAQGQRPTCRADTAVAGLLFPKMKQSLAVLPNQIESKSNASDG